ncbi:Cation efflux protein like protein, partial [Aduncisulcus paluster]
MAADTHEHGSGHSHGHGVSANADRKWLTIALILIGGFMAVEVVIGVIAQSLALISDAGHMLTDAASIVLALIAIRLASRPARGSYTYGLKRAEILSAQANGVTLFLLAAFFIYEGIRRLITPPEVSGLLVFVTALAGIVVNGAFQHILNDLYAFIATAIAGAVVWLTGFTRADAIAALVVAALMLKAGWGLVRESGRIFLEAAPVGLDPDTIGAQLASVESVTEVHDLHIWQITSGQPALSAHILVVPNSDCHGIRREIEELLHTRYDIDHTTLQVDHEGAEASTHCLDPHGEPYRAEDNSLPGKGLTYLAATHAVLIAVAVTMILRHRKHAPEATVIVGSASVLGLGYVHLMPTYWPAVQDSFVSGPRVDVTWFSWVTVVISIGAAMV